MKEPKDNETLVILKHPGWWVKDGEIVGFGQISPRGGPNHVLWGRALGMWEPMPRNVIVVVIALEMKANHLRHSYNYARAISV